MIDPTYADVPSVLVIADDGAGADAAADAVRLAGARMVDCVALAAGVGRLRVQAALDAVLIEAAGSDETALLALLGEVDGLARERGAAVVVAMDASQIDLVAAQLLGRGELLCDPSVTDRATALAVIARHDPPALHDVTRDEAERLRLLNAEVARIAETLARLTRGETSAQRDRQLREAERSYGAPPSAVEPEPVAPARVRAAIRARRLRASFFTPELFADPAWDMLLDLFAAELEHVRVSVSSLCIAAAVPGTTALRWIGTMIDAGLFERHADPFDRRRAYVTLTAKAVGAMQRYFDALRRAGLAAG